MMKLDNLEMAIRHFYFIFLKFSEADVQYKHRVCKRESSNIPFRYFFASHVFMELGIHTYSQNPHRTLTGHSQDSQDTHRAFTG